MRLGQLRQPGAKNIEVRKWSKVKGKKILVTAMDEWDAVCLLKYWWPYYEVKIERVEELPDSAMQRFECIFVKQMNRLNEVENRQL